MLSERAVLVTLNIGMWNAQVRDDKASRNAADAYGAKPTSIKSFKKLIEDTSLSAIHNLGQKLRQTHYSLTVPWGDDNCRMLTTKGYFDYCRIMGDLKDSFEKAVDEFIPKYPDLVEAAKIMLNTGWRQEDYPHHSHIKDKFYTAIHFSPVPEKGDFRVGLDDNDLERLNTSLEEANNAKLKEATKEVWTRLEKVVDHMATTLENYGPGKRLFDSVVDNVKELATNLPKLNLTEDPEMDKTAQDILSRLTQFSTETLRESEQLRNTVAVEAKNLVERIKGYGL